ncbi:NADH-quinone oxidoreductase subunit K [Sorangium sp. So ce315]|uniref:sodium:proton antiporter n=1 Tax=Sorangium sp. So ce315 TaxID=3133299 RepID=UPI003F61BE93
MIGPAAISAFALFAAGIYLLLSTSAQETVIGFILLSNGVNLLVLASAGLPEGALPPLLSGTPAPRGPFADPLAQAFLLTAIVIGLGMSSFLLALSLRAHAPAPPPPPAPPAAPPETAGDAPSREPPA